MTAGTWQGRLRRRCVIGCGTRDGTRLPSGQAALGFGGGPGQDKAGHGYGDKPEMGPGPGRQHHDRLGTGQASRRMPRETTHQCGLRQGVVRGRKRRVGPGGDKDQGTRIGVVSRPVPHLFMRLST